MGDRGAVAMVKSLVCAAIPTIELIGSVVGVGVHECGSRCAWARVSLYMPVCMCICLSVVRTASCCPNPYCQLVTLTDTPRVCLTSCIHWSY